MYVRYILSQDKHWAGHESIQAISDKHKVNILIFNEGDQWVLYTNEKETHERSIAIVFRIGYEENGTSVRNHYDSVSDIKSDDIWAATDSVIKRMK